MAQLSNVRRIAIAAALLFALSLALRWPGVAMYDSVTQYRQALTGDYTDWHPPIMARLWSCLLPLWPGTAPVLILQMLLWWGGLALIAMALARCERPWSASLALAIGAFPLFLGWETVVLKDAQMAACLVLATGLVGWWRLQDRRLPAWAIGAILVLIAYATLVRGNAVFATVPFGCALAGWGGLRRWWGRTVLVLIGCVAVLALSGPINHRLFAADVTHNDRALPLWDIVAVAHRASVAPPGVPPADWALAEQRGCYTPFFWNPYGEPRECLGVGSTIALSDDPHPGLMRDWALSVLRHPLAYAAHRLAHFNATTRFLVGWGEPDAEPPRKSEPNPFGLGAPPTLGGRALIRVAEASNGTPLGWPIVWLGAGLALAWGLAGHRSAQADLARALILSALAMSGSFLVVSLASDLRYHLWSMIAVALALALGIREVPRDRRRPAAGVVLALAGVALVARFTAPPVYAPQPASHPSPAAAPR